MKKTISLFIIATLCSAITVFAQRSNSHLTIISENNEPFLLYINNVQYNQSPKVGVRVENINKTGLPVKLVFPLKSNATVSHINLPITDLEGYGQDITYSVNENRRGDKAFMVYAVVPMEPINIDERQIEVFDNNGKKLRQQFDNLNKRWINPQTVYRGGNNNRQQPTTDRIDNKPHVMNDVEFNNALRTIKNNSMDEAKLDIAKTIFSNYLISTQQVKKVLEVMSFENNKLDFAKYAYNRCSDKKNYHTIQNVFKFSSSKKELNKYISDNQ